MQQGFLSLDFLAVLITAAYMGKLLLQGPRRFDGRLQGEFAPNLYAALHGKRSLMNQQIYRK